MQQNVCRENLSIPYNKHFQQNKPQEGLFIPHCSISSLWKIGLRALRLQAALSPGAVAACVQVLNHLSLSSLSIVLRCFPHGHLRFFVTFLFFLSFLCYLLLCFFATFKEGYQSLHLFYGGGGRGHGGRLIRSNFEHIASRSHLSIQ